MKLNETFSCPGATVEAVYALITDQAFRESSADADGALARDITVEPNTAGGETVTIIRTMPANLPDFVKKFTGETVKIKQVEEWGGPDSAGSRTAKISVNVIGQPAEMIGTATLDGKSRDADLIIDGDVKVKVPFLGKKIEPEIGKAILSSVRHESELRAKQFS